MNLILLAAIALLAIVLMQTVTAGQTPPPGSGPVPPSYVPADDWQQVIATCGGDHIAYLVAAIGWQETHWGQLGAGRDGYILGVGVTAQGPNPIFQGLAAQIGWACPRLRSAFPSAADVTPDAVTAFAATVWVPGDPGSWAWGVYGEYRNRVPLMA